jgi:hypothetical protein
MSMHLEGPWLSMQGKKKGKRKFRNADEAARARELEADWQALLKKYPAKKVPALAKKTSIAPVNLNHERSTRHIPSLDTGGGSTAAVPVKVYTGDKMVGIGTMHKSNMVPIFSDQEAKDISTMRRG